MNFSHFLSLINGVPRTVDLSNSANVLELGGNLQLDNGGSHIILSTQNVASSYQLNWPANQAASAGYVLTNDGIGNLSWTSPSAGSVTSVGLVLPSIFNVTVSPITSSGNLTAVLNTQSANMVWAGPTTGSAAAPTFRSLVAADIPSSITSNTSGTASNITATSNSTLTTLSSLVLPTSQLSGSISLTSQVSGILPIANGGTGQSAKQAAFDALSPLGNAGDSLYYNGSHNVALPIGTSGQVLTVVAGEPAWAAPSISPTEIALAQNHILVGDASNFAADVAMSGEASIVASGAVTLSNAAVIAKVLTGYVAGAGSVSSSDSILSAIEKIDGNDQQKLPLAGGTMSGNIDMGSNKIVNLANGTTSNDAVNYAQLQAITSGLIWQQSVNDPDLVDDSLTSPPGSPAYSITYIIGASATGAWAGLDGHAVWWDGLHWIDISTNATAASGFGTAVQVGDRFAVAIGTAGAASYIGGGLTGKANNLAQVTNNTPGSFAYTFTAPVASYAVSVTDTGSQHYGSSYTYSASLSAWVDFSGPSKVDAGDALAYDGNILNVLYDGTTIDLTSNKLEVKAGGITNTQISGSAAIAYSKLNLTGDIVNADIASAAAIAFSKLAALTSANILVGNGSNVATSVAVSGDLTLANTGAFSVAKILGTVVSGTTGSGNVVFSSSPTFAGTISGVAANFSGAISASNFSGSSSGTNTGDQTITLTGDVTGSGTGSFAATISAAAVTLSKLASDSVDENKIVSTALSSTGALAGGSGTKLSVKVDNSSIDINGSDQLEVKNAGVTAAKLATGAFDQVTILGGAGTAASVAQAPVVASSEVAGESLSATTLVALRYELAADAGTAGQMYKADNDASSADNFYVIGLAYPASSVSASDPVMLVQEGLINVPGHGFTVGVPLYLGASGALTTSSPVSAGLAIVKVGQVKDANNIRVGVEIIGIN